MVGLFTSMTNFITFTKTMFAFSNILRLRIDEECEDPDRKVGVYNFSIHELSFQFL